MLRRTRKDVGRELPPLQRIPHEIGADLNEIEKMSGTAAELARIILAKTEAEKGDRMKAAGELDWRLRQATGIAKAHFVAEFVRMLVDNGEKVLVYGWHREVYALLGAKLSELTPSFYTGQETVPQKQEAFDRFVKGDTKVLIMSLRAGAGLDGLQGHCRTVVFAELDWSPGVHDQCIGRVNRDGQVDPVTAYFLIANCGSDPVIADVLDVKRGQIENIRDPTLEMEEQMGQDSVGHIRRLAEAFLNKHGLAASA